MTQRSETPADFVARVDRIEIGLDVADYLVGVIELLGRLQGRPMPALPGRLVAIQRALARAGTGAATADASAIITDQSGVTGVNASTKGSAVLGLSQSEPRRVNSRTAAQMLHMTTNGVRDRCREDKLDFVKSGGQYWITVESIESYPRRSPKRAKDPTHRETT